ncbi:MAG: S-ribosylhomocysteine lyase [Candidatus Avispirillum sp.]
MDKIASFTVDHDFIRPGMYVSRTDGDTVTYDLRTRRPNAGDYMDNITMHSVEHMFATYARGGRLGERVIYFGPMGCRTGFYLIMRDRDRRDDYEYVKETLEKIIAHDGEMFGASPKECGNYRELDIEAAKREAARYLRALKEREEAGKADLEYDRQ